MKSVGKGVFSLAPAISVKSTSSFSNSVRDGGLCFAKLVQLRDVKESLNCTEVYGLSLQRFVMLVP